MSEAIVQHSAGPSSSSSVNQVPDIIVSQQTTVLSPKSVSDELVRRHQQKQYEDYESDDELRREDISFPIDGGEWRVLLKHVSIEKELVILWITLL